MLLSAIAKKIISLLFAVEAKHARRNGIKILQHILFFGRNFGDGIYNFTTRASFKDNAALHITYYLILLNRKIKYWVKYLFTLASNIVNYTSTLLTLILFILANLNVRSSLAKFQILFTKTKWTLYFFVFYTTFFKFAGIQFFYQWAYLG